MREAKGQLLQSHNITFLLDTHAWGYRPDPPLPLARVPIRGGSGNETKLHVHSHSSRLRVQDFNSFVFEETYPKDMYTAPTTMRPVSMENGILSIGSCTYYIDYAVHVSSKSLSLVIR